MQVSDFDRLVSAAALRYGHRDILLAWERGGQSSQWRTAAWDGKGRVRLLLAEDRLLIRAHRPDDRSLAGKLFEGSDAVEEAVRHVLGPESS